jgi:hypothetical protein
MLEMIDIFTKDKSFIPGKTTRDQAKDTGMALTLICILIGYFGGKQGFIGGAVALLLVTMIWPDVYKPAAKLWFGLSHVLGTVMSGALLSMLFFTLVVPVGLARRAMRKDSLQLRKWKKDHASVFRVRDHKFTPVDIQHPY